MPKSKKSKRKSGKRYVPGIPKLRIEASGKTAVPTLESGNAMRIDPSAFQPAAVTPVGYTPAEYSVGIALYQESQKLLHIYNSKLPDFKYGQSREKIMALDKINVTEAIQHLSEDEIAVQLYNEYAETSDDFYSIVPCFTEGCIEFAAGCYIHWRIEDLDAQARMIKLHLAAYFDEPTVGWSPGVSCDITMHCGDDTTEKNPDPETVHYDANIENEFLYHKIYKIIKLDKLGWTDRQKQIWQNTICAYANQIEALFPEDASPAKALVEWFCKSMSVLNYYLDINSPVARPDKPKPAQKRTYAKTPADETSGRKVRMVGLIPVLSRRPPRLPTAETIIHYKLAAWKVRGHVRHYKSGKTAYIKPTDRHRRAIKDIPDTGVPAQTIYVKDNIPKGESE